MPTTCCAYGCTNRLTKQNTSISFHRFPSDENRKNEWIKAVRRQNWFPNKNTRICSVHFEESMFDRTMNRVLLKENSVPSIFKAFPSMQKMPRHDQNKYVKTYRKKGQPYRKKCKAVNSCSAELNGDVKSDAPDDWITIEDSKEVKFVIEIENADNDVVLPMNDDDDSCHNNSSSLSGKCEQNEPNENAESSVEKDLNIVASHCQSVLKQQMNSDEKDMELISTESATGFEYVEEHICEKIEVKEEMISSDAQLDLEGETELNDLNDTHDNKLSGKLNNDAHDKELTDELNDDTHKNELTNNKLPVNGVISEISNTNRLKKRDLVEVIQPKSGKVVVNKKLLACVYCGVYFSEHKELLFHQISVHGLKGFICFLCGRNITYNKNEDSLACHILEYHKDINSTDTERRLKNVNSFMKEQPSLLTSVTRMSLASSKISLTFHQIPLAPTQSSLAASQTSFVSSQISSMSSSKKGNSLGNCVQNELHCDVVNTMSDYNAYVTELIKEKDTSGNVIFWSSPTNICSKANNIADGCSESEEISVVKNDVDNLDMPAEVTSGNVIFWSSSTNICSKANNIADGCSESEEISVVKNDVDNLDMPAEVTSGNVIFWSSSTNICSKANNIADGCSESEEIVAVKNDVDNLDMSSKVPSGNAICQSSSTNICSKANNIADGCSESEEIVAVKNDVDNLDMSSEVTSGNAICRSSSTNVFSKANNIADGCSESEEIVAVKNDVDNLDMSSEVTSGNAICRSSSTNVFSKANNIADGCSESEEIVAVKNDVDNLDMSSEVPSGNAICQSSSTNICSKANNIADGCSESEEIVAVKNDVDNLDMSSEVTSGNAICRSSSTNVFSKANNIADGCSESEEIVTVKNDVDNLAIPSEENTECSRSNINIIGTSFENQENAMEGLEQVENTNVLRVYYCDVCHKIFKSRRYSLLHMKLHTHKKVPCKTCEKIFYSLGELKVHEKVHKKLPECRECGKVLHGKGQLSRHLLTHTERLCDLCGEVCTSMYSLTQHKVKHNYKPVQVPRQMQEVICHTCGKFVRNLPLHMKVHEDKSQQPTEGAIFCCDTCGKLFKSRSQFKHHLTSHTSDYAPTYTCTECPKKFFTRCNLTQHALQHKEPKFECAHCDRRFRRFSQLRLHSRVHRFGTNSERLYRCFICQAAFKTYEDRFKHRMQHTQEEIDKYKKEHYKKRTNKKNPKVNGPLKKFKCDFCEKTFSSKISLLMHCYTHTGEKPLKCSFCEACFGTKIGLKSHELIHTGERPYKCNVCEKAFRGLNTLNQHMSVHLTEMPFVCDVCKKGFNRRFSLICHLRVHTNERPYPCKICGRAFKQSSDRRKHELLHKKK